MADDGTVHLDTIVVAPPVANPGFAADHGLPADTLFESYPGGSGYVPYGPAGSQTLDRQVFDRRLVGSPDGSANLSLEERLRDKRAEAEPGGARPPPPTAPVPHPPEIVPEDRAALAVCLSPDVCRSPQAPVPYMSWGKGDDEEDYSPDVFANGLRVKRRNSRFSRCYGDEPGTGLGVVSNTVGDVVEPVTSSTIVRVNGVWVQRHTDRCTLNRGNAPGEYLHVKSTETSEAPDGDDAQDKTRAEKIADYARSKGYTRVPGGWDTNPNGDVGFISDELLGEQMDYVASGAGRPRPFTMGSGQAELKPYEPSWAENTQHWIQERLEGLGMGRYQARDLGEKVRTLGEFAPVTGSALSANESKRAFDSGQYLLSGIHAIGALPIPGAGKLAEKLGAKGVERLAREEAERLAAKAAEERAAQEAAEAAARRNASVDGADGARVTARKPPTTGKQLTRDEYEWLRSRTPTDALTNKMNEGQAVASRDNPVPDPWLPGKDRVARLEADHIVPMKQITEMDGFADLTRDNQLKVLNNPDNFTALSRSANGSKGAKSFEEWTTYGKGPSAVAVNPQLRQQMIERSRQLQPQLQNQIYDLLKSQ